MNPTDRSSELIHYLSKSILHNASVQVRVSVSFAIQLLLKAGASGFWQTIILSCSTLPHMAEPVGWSTKSIQLDKDAALIYLKTLFQTSA